jgi:hypothetical protein
MNTNVFATAAALSDQDLLARLSTLAGHERETLAELLAHLATLDERPGVYAARGYGSLYAYCTQALRFSEDAACNRIDAARVCLRFPIILDMLASGEMTLASIRLLGRHLTAENHQAVLAKAKGRTREEIEILVATLAPQPDARSLVRKLPTPTMSAPPPTAMGAAARPAPRPMVKPTAPERYRVQFTIGQDTREKLRRLQALLRREIPDGDPGVLFDRAITALLAQLESRKLGLTAKPRSHSPIRPGTDTGDIRTPPPPSRGVPRAVRHAAWKGDRGQCGFVSTDGRRCTERTFLEFHHVRAYAKGGPATADNISLRCRRHNQYEAELIFGPHRTSIVREDAAISS